MDDEPIWMALTITRADDQDLEYGVMLLEWTPALRDTFRRLQMVYTGFAALYGLQADIGHNALEFLSFRTDAPLCFTALPIGETREESITWEKRLDLQRGYHGDLFTGLLPTAGGQWWPVVRALLMVDEWGCEWRITVEPWMDHQQDWLSRPLSWKRLTEEREALDVVWEMATWKEDAHE